MDIRVSHSDRALSTTRHSTVWKPSQTVRVATLHQDQHEAIYYSYRLQFLRLPVVSLAPIASACSDLSDFRTFPRLTSFACSVLHFERFLNYFGRFHPQMASLTEGEKADLLQECTEYKSQTRTYIRLLGFRQLSLSKCESGSQRFSGIVQELNEATKEEVNALAAGYESRKEVQEAVRNHILSPQITEPFLEQYGSSIWNNGESEPYVTRCDEFYPRHLVFENAADQER